MSKHETKTCPRCNSHFECRPGDITNCQCYGIELNIATEGFIASHYGDCLCRNCLQQLQQSYFLFKDQPELYKQR
jgi:hypothetical protein